MAFGKRVDGVGQQADVRPRQAVRLKHLVVKAFGQIGREPHGSSIAEKPVLWTNLRIKESAPGKSAVERRVKTHPAAHSADPILSSIGLGEEVRVSRMLAAS